MIRVLGILFALVACAAIGCWETKSDETKQTSSVKVVREQLLRSHHEQCVEVFAKAQGFGGERMPRLVPHTYGNYPGSLILPFEQPEQSPPGQPLPESVTGWRMEKFELVGLMLSPTPQVYEARQVLQEQKQKSKRDPDGFEVNSLARLRSGEDICVQDTGEQVRMVGAIRARQDCVKCHDNKPVGTLLGAFSYVFLPGMPQQQEAGQQQAPAPVLVNPKTEAP